VVSKTWKRFVFSDRIDQLFTRSSAVSHCITIMFSNNLVCFAVSISSGSIYGCSAVPSLISGRSQPCKRVHTTVPPCINHVAERTNPRLIAVCPVLQRLENNGQRAVSIYRLPSHRRFLAGFVERSFRVIHCNRSLVFNQSNNLDVFWGQCKLFPCGGG